MTRNLLNVLLVIPFLAFPALALAQADDASDDTGDIRAARSELQIVPAEAFDIDQFLWTNRILVVFADTPADPRFIKQMGMISERQSDLIERDVLVVIDTDPDARSAVRTKLRPRGFALVLVDKDGGVKLRKPSPWSTREIARSIDKTPLRRQEIRDRSDPSG